MADITTNADFLLTVGVDVGLSLEPMQKGLEELVKQLNSKPLLIKFEADTSSMEAQIAKVTGSDSSGKKRQSNAKQTSQAYKEATQAINQYYAKLKQLSLAEKEAFETYNKTGKTDAKYSSLIAELNHLKTAYDNAIAGKNSMTAAEQREITSLDTMQQLELASAIERRTNAILQNKAVMTSSETVMSQANATLARCTKAEHSHKQSSRDAVAAIRQKMAAVVQAQNAVKAGSATDEEAAAKVRVLQEATKDLRLSLKENYAIIQQNGDATKGLGERLVGLGKKFTQWFGVSQLIMAAYRAIRKMITAVKELDTAMTELKKVTDETDETYQRFLENASIRAKKLGASLTDVVKTTADFARLGFSLEDAEVVSDAALVYKNVGDGIEDIDQASESLISTMQAFGVEAKDVMSIVDKFNTTGNKFAISSGGVGDALLNSAAALNAAGNSLDESIGLITAANTTIQNPEKVGTALKTVSMYLRAAKTEAEDAGESTDGMANSVSELRGELLALTGNRVDIQIDEDNFKSTYEILKDLSKVWNSLSDVSQANITEMIGGKRNANVISTLLKDFEKAEAVVTQTANSSGSAMEENEKVLESIQGKLNILSATFETFSQNLIGSNTVKFFVDFATGILSVLDAFARLNTLLPAVIGNFLIFKAIGIAKNLANMKAQVSVLTQSLIQEKGVTDQLTAAVYGLTLAEKQELVTQLEQAVTDGLINKTEKDLILTKLGLTGATTGLTVANKGLAASFKAVAASIPVWGWISLIITVIIEAITALSALSNSIEDTAEKFNELKNTIKSTRDELKSTISSVESIRDEYAVLAQGVDKYGNNVSLTDEEYKKFIQHNNQLAEQFPNLVKGYNSNGVAILGLAGGVQEITNAIDKLIESMQSTANVTLLKSADTDYKTIHNQVKNLRDEIAQLRKDAAELPITVERAAGEITQQDYSKAFKTSAEAIYYQRELAAKGISSAILEDVEVALEGDLNPQMYKIVAASIEDVRAYELKQAEEIAAKANTEYQALMEQIEVKQNELESVVSQFDDYINAYLSSVGNGGFNYAKIKSSMGDVGSLIVHSLIDNLNMNEYEDVDAFYDAIDEILLKVKKVGDAENWGAIQESIQKITDAGDTMSFKAFTDEYDNFIKLLKNSGASQDVIDSLSAMFDYKSIKNNVAQVKNMVKDEYDHLIDGLSIKDINTAIKYIIDADDNSLTWDELSQEIKKATPIKTTIEVYTDVNSLASGLDQLDKIYADIFNGEEFDFNALVSDDFTNTFGGLGDAYSDFLEIVANSPKDIGACQDAFNNLTTAYLLNSDVLNEVTEETRNVTVAMLEQKGVANAAALVDEQLALVKEKTRIATEAGSNATYNQILDLYDEETASRVTAQAIYELAIAKIQTNENQILTSSDIEQLDALAKTAGASTESLLNLAKAKSLAAQADNYTAKAKKLEEEGGYNAHVVDFYERKAADLLEEAKEWYNKPITYNRSVATYAGGSSTKSAKSSAAKSAKSSAAKAAEKEAKEAETWFERQLKDHQHLVAMEQETEAEYLAWLDKAYKQAYKEGIIELDDYYKYQEEVFEKSRELFEDGLADIEHEISMRENYEGEEKKIISLYQGLIADVEREIANARVQGLTDEDDYIQELQEKWQDYANAIKDIREEIEEAAKDALDEMVDYRVDMLKQEIEDEKDALDKKLDYLKEFYDKQKEMLQDQYDEEKYLQDQAEKRKSVTDIKSELAMLEKDDSAWAQKRKLELQEELSTAEQDLADFEKENALEKALDAIDEAYNSQEAQLQKEMDALDEKLNDPNALFNKALEDIKNNSKNQLYYQMLMYNRQYGSGNDDDIKKLWEDTYGALNDYEQLFGKLYKGVDLKNETGVKKNDGWDNSKVSGTNPDKPKETHKTTTTTTKTETTKPSLIKGSYVQVKSGTRWYADSYGGGSSGKANAGTIKYINTKGSHPYNIDGLGWVKKSDIVGYSSGTKHATAGLHELYEQGSEMLFVSSSGGKYRILEDGDKVLNAKATNFLYDFANGGENALAQMLKNVFSGASLSGISPTVINNEINMGDIVITGSANQKTVSEIRREQRSSMDYMLRELNKLNK